MASKRDTKISSSPPIFPPSSFLTSNSNEVLSFLSFFSISTEKQDGNLIYEEQTEANVVVSSCHTISSPVPNQMVWGKLQKWISLSQHWNSLTVLSQKCESIFQANSTVSQLEWQIQVCSRGNVFWCWYKYTCWNAPHLSSILGERNRRGKKFAARASAVWRARSRSSSSRVRQAIINKVCSHSCVCFLAYREELHFHLYPKSMENGSIGFLLDSCQKCALKSGEELLN